ncbi:T9SS type A sorting domain-containing protein [Bacteroidota bacterium]
MIRSLALVIFCLLLSGSSAQDARWFAIDSPGDLIWLSRPELLDADGDGFDEFPDLQSKWLGNYFLTDSIVFDPDSSAVDWNGDGLIDHTDLAGFQGIGTEEIPFKGYFDGRYNRIKNLYLSGTYERTALFGVINGATIENLRLEELKIFSNSNYNGGIAGRADQVLAPGDSNIIRRCIVSGKFVLSMDNNNLYTGGIIGRTDNTHIIECASFVKMFAIGDSLDNRRVGGIAGQLSGNASIDDSYSISTVSAYEQSALLVARSYDDAGVKIRNCYAAGPVSATSDTARSTLGVFAGLLGSPEVLSCYFDSSVSEFPGVGESDVPLDVNGLSTAGFSESSNFAGWDFNTTWQIKEIEGVQRPRLIWEDKEELSTEALLCPKRALCLAPVHQWERTQAPAFIPENTLASFLVHPNPANRFIQVDTDHFPEELSIYNLFGQKVISGQILSGSKRVDVSQLPAGMYILRTRKHSEVFIVVQ